MLWDVRPARLGRSPAQTIVDRVVGAARDGSVILLHTFPAQTTVALPGIIAGLRARGFGFVTIPQLLSGGGSPQLRSATPPPPVAFEATIVEPRRPTPGRALGKPVLVVSGLLSKRTSWIHDPVHRRLPEPD